MLEKPYTHEEAYEAGKWFFLSFILQTSEFSIDYDSFLIRDNAWISLLLRCIITVILFP